MPKKALITGITGQDGSYLAELLLDKGYEVYGIVRRASTFNRWRLHHLHKCFFDRNRNFYLEYGDLTDPLSLTNIMRKAMPDEVYNLGAQSHVQVSFETPEYTANCDALGALRLIEAMKAVGVDKTAKFYQASTSELYGNATETPQSEKTPFYPKSPYGVAKLYAFWIVKNYREAYNFFGVNGILFNHESPRRGENFVSKKITSALAKIKLGCQEKLVLGNLNARRDWGYAKEFVEAMWLMIQHNMPEDFVVATGEMHTVREFVEEACAHLGIPLVWEGEGRNEKGIDRLTGKVIVELDDRYLRPAEVDILRGDNTKIKNVLGWQPKTAFKELVKMMCDFDLEAARRNNHEILIDHQ